MRTPGSGKVLAIRSIRTGRRRHSFGYQSIKRVQVNLPTYRPLHAIDDITVSRSIGAGPDFADRLDHLVLEVGAIDQDEDGDRHLSNEDHEQDGGIGHNHAVGFANGSAASEEGDEEHNAAEDDQEDGGESGVIVLEGSLQVTGLGQGKGSECDQSNAAQLKKRVNRERVDQYMVCFVILQ